MLTILHRNAYVCSFIPKVDTAWCMLSSFIFSSMAWEPDSIWGLSANCWPPIPCLKTDLKYYPVNIGVTYDQQTVPAVLADFLDWIYHFKWQLPKFLTILSRQWIHTMAKNSSTGIKPLSFPLASQYFWDYKEKESTKERTTQKKNDNG